MSVELNNPRWYYLLLIPQFIASGYIGFLAQKPGSDKEGGLLYGISVLFFGLPVMVNLFRNKGRGGVFVANFILAFLNAVVGAAIGAWIGSR